MTNISTKILEAVNENGYKEYREDTVYNYFTEIISYLSNKEIKKLADSLIEYVENDKLFDKEEAVNESKPIDNTRLNDIANNIYNILADHNDEMIFEEGCNMDLTMNNNIYIEDNATGDTYKLSITSEPVADKED